MKKVILISALFLCLFSGIASGSLALYSASVDNISGGNAIAKRFEFDVERNETFSKNLKIAPGDSVIQVFTVSNYKLSDKNEKIFAEVPILTNGSIEISAADGKKTIPYLTAKLYGIDNKGVNLQGIDKLTAKDLADNAVSQSSKVYNKKPYQIKGDVENGIIKNGKGKLSFVDTYRMLIENKRHIKYYAVVIEWPENPTNNIDTQYQGDDFGIKITINITGTQVLAKNVNNESYKN